MMFTTNPNEIKIHTMQQPTKKPTSNSHQKAKIFKTHVPKTINFIKKNKNFIKLGWLLQTLIKWVLCHENRNFKIWKRKIDKNIERLMMTQLFGCEFYKRKMGILVWKERGKIIKKDLFVCLLLKGKYLNLFRLVVVALWSFISFLHIVIIVTVIKLFTVLGCF